MQPFIETCIEKAFDSKIIIDSIAGGKDLGYLVSDISLRRNTLHITVRIARLCAEVLDNCTSPDHVSWPNSVDKAVRLNCSIQWKASPCQTAKTAKMMHVCLLSRTIGSNQTRYKLDTERGLSMSSWFQNRAF